RAAAGGIDPAGLSRPSSLASLWFIWIFPAPRMTRTHALRGGRRCYPPAGIAFTSRQQTSRNAFSYPEPERRQTGPYRRQQQDPVLLLLREEPARGAQADRGTERVHLRRVRRAVQRHHPRGTRGEVPELALQPAQAEGD